MAANAISASGRWFRAIGLKASLAIGLIGVTPLALATVQEEVRNDILRDLPSAKVAQLRASCATGDIPTWLAKLRSAGLRTLSAGGYCVTVFTRAGRDGTLHYMTLSSGKSTPAIAFDTGFVDGYLRRETIPADAPPLTALLPVADRCLDQSEPKLRLCGLAGQMLGARAAHGELVPTS